MNYKDRTLSYFDAFFFAILVGGGETYFTAYSLSLGHGELKAGLLATLPLALGGIIQLGTPYIVNKIGRYRVWVYFSALIQSLVLLTPIIIQNIGYSLLFLIVCLYWSLFFSSSSVWSAWISQVISPKDYLDFFSKRTGLIYIGTFLGMVVSGVILQVTNSFEAIFSIGIISRVLSAFSIYFKSDQGVVFRPMTSFNISFFKELKNYSNLYKVTIFVLFFRGTIFIAAPFFTPYMFEVLKLNYFQFMTIIAANFFGRILIMKIAKGIINDTNIKLYFVMSALGITVLPILWLIQSDYYYLLCVEIFSGIVWGLFELIFLLKIFHKIPAEKNGNFNISLNLFNSAVIAVASLLGGAMFYYFSIMAGALKYEYLFIVSTVLRGSCLLFLPSLNITKFSSKIIPFIRPVVGRSSAGLIRINWRILREIKRNKK